MTREEAVAGGKALARELGPGWSGRVLGDGERLNWSFSAYNIDTVEVCPNESPYGAPYVARCQGRYWVGGISPNVGAAKLGTLLRAEGERLKVASSLPLEEEIP